METLKQILNKARLQLYTLTTKRLFTVVNFMAY